MSDLISRQAAIDVLSRYPFEKVVNCISILEEMPPAQPKISMLTVTVAPDSEEIERVASKIKNAPVMVLSPTEPERKKGKWIVVTRHEHYPSGKPYEQLQCPFCNRIDHNGDGNFCGYCGAELR